MVIVISIPRRTLSPNTALVKNIDTPMLCQRTTRAMLGTCEQVITPNKTWSAYSKPISDQNGEASTFHISKSESDQEALARLAHKAEQKVPVSEAELRDILRRAAALLCKADVDQCGIVRYLIEIPFTIFTKQSIKLGISLWLGVINENPIMEPRILTEIAQNWETTVHTNAGVFSEKLRQVRCSI